MEGFSGGETIALLIHILPCRMENGSRHFHVAIKRNKCQNMAFSNVLTCVIEEDKILKFFAFYRVRGGEKLCINYPFLTTKVFFVLQRLVSSGAVGVRKLRRREKL